MVSERARVVVGADGVGSFIARAVGAASYREVPALEALYLAYWQDYPHDGEFALYSRDRRGFGTIPTNEGLTVLVVTWPADEFDANRYDLLGSYLRAFEATPELADRISGARRVSRPVGMLMGNFSRQSYGPGWALAGDAGYHKDAVTAQGISDAFRDAEALAAAIDDVLARRRSWDEALGDYQRTRDELTQAMFDLTCQLASPDAPDEETLGLFSMIAADRGASEDLVSVLAGTLQVEAFFDPANIGRYQLVAGASPGPI